MQSPNLYWPSDRKLFRQRSRLRSGVAVVAALALALLLVAASRHGWF